MDAKFTDSMTLQTKDRQSNEQLVSTKAKNKMMSMSPTGKKIILIVLYNRDPTD